MTVKSLAVGALAFFILFSAGLPTSAQADDFYKDKTVRIIVGYRVGGGYDVYTRAVSRHMGKYIPGNPTIIVENMGGAGSLVAANYLYNRADKDGLTLGVFGGGMVTQQALGEKGIRFDAKKFNWLGSMGQGTPACVIMAFTGLKTMEDILKSKKELRFGSTGPGSTTDDLPKLLKGILNAPIKVIGGYKGTSAVRLGMQRKELDGACWTWESIRTTARAMLDAKGENRLIPFAIEGNYPDAEIKDVPQVTSFIKNKEDLAAIKAWLNPYKFFRPMVAPPGTPEDRVALLQTGLAEAIKDPDFIAETKKGKIDVVYTPPTEVVALVNETLDIPEGAVAKLKTLIGRKH